MNQRTRGRSVNARQPSVNSVSYGRWLASTVVTKSSRGANASLPGKRVLQENNSSEEISRYFPKADGPKNGSANFEFGFESLQRCVRGNKKPKMTTNTGECMAHIKDVKRLNENYLGPDLAYLKGFMTKEKPTSSTVNANFEDSNDVIMDDGTTETASITDDRREEETASVTPQVLDSNLQTAIPQPVPSVIFATRAVASRESYVESTKAISSMGQEDQEKANVLDAVFARSTASNLLGGDGAFIRPKLPRRCSKMKLPKASSDSLSVSQIKWGSSSGVQSLVKSKPVTRITDLAQDEEFVFNPKFAEVLRKLPELRHQVIPANAVPMTSLPIHSQLSVTVRSGLGNSTAGTVMASTMVRAEATTPIILSQLNSQSAHHYTYDPSFRLNF